jgi:hypothetical protein
MGAMNSWYRSKMGDVPAATVEAIAEQAVRDAVQAVADLNTTLVEAYFAGDGRTVERVLAELSAAEHARNRLLQRAVADAARPDTLLPVRERVARVLRLLGRPAPVALIRDVASARFGDALTSAQLASLRRDEHRSWMSATATGGHRAVNRPVYVVPALTYDRMAPMRGVLALSSWPVAARLIAPASPRVDLLHVVDTLVGEAFHAPDAPWAPDIRRLLWRLGHTVPGGAGTNLASLRDAVAAELSQLDEEDAAERAVAASRATTQLPEEDQLFGARPAS